MGEPGGDILHLARFPRRVGADIAFLGQHPVVHEPEATLRHLHLAGDGAVRVGGLDHQRAVFLEFRFQKIERAFALDDMRIGVDRPHGGSP